MVVCRRVALVVPAGEAASCSNSPYGASAGVGGGERVREGGGKEGAGEGGERVRGEGGERVRGKAGE